MFGNVSRQYNLSRITMTFSMVNGRPAYGGVDDLLAYVLMLFVMRFCGSSFVFARATTTY